MAVWRRSQAVMKKVAREDLLRKNLEMMESAR
jgi:hypothetical protein